MRVLINKSYSSSPRFYHFIKYGMPIKERTRNRRQFFDRLAVLNLSRKSEMFDNIDDKEINKVIQEQIQIHHNNPTIRKRWQNTKIFIGYASNAYDVNLFL